MAVMHESAVKKNKNSFFPANRFVRSVSILAGGTATGQLIVVIASPLLTRLYSPEDFGLLAVYTALLGILSVVASLRYQLAIPLPADEAKATHLVVLSLLVVLGTAMLTALSVVFFRESIANVLNISNLDKYLWLLPVGLLLTGTYQVFNYWALRTRAFPAVARTRLTQALSMVGVQLACYSFGPMALILGQVSGQAAGTTSLGRLTIWKHWSMFRQVRLSGILYAANRYRRFPLFSTWEGLFNSAGSQLPALLFAALFNASTAGIYMIAHRVLAIPMKLIGKAIADVFFSDAAEAHRKGQLAPLVAGIHEKLAHIAIPPALILALAGPDLFALVFGPDWRQAGEFAQWMTPWIYLVFITSPLSTLFAVLEKQFQGVVFQGILLTMRICALLIGAYLQNVMLAVALFSIGSSICYLGLLAWIVRASKNNWSILWSATVRSLAWGILLVAPLILFYILSDDAFLWLAAFVLSGLLIICRYLLLLKKVM